MKQSRLLSAACAVILVYSNAAAAISFTPLGILPGGSQSEARGVSADGSVVVGWSESASTPGGREAFRWTSGGGMVGLGDLPGGIFSSQAYSVSADGSVVVGASGSASGSEAFRWTSAGGMVGLGDLPGGGFSSTAWGVSGDGSVVVGDSDSASGFEAFRWTSAGGMVGLGDLPGGSFSSTANSVSGDGTVVVGRSESTSGFEAFRWTSGGGMVGLGDLPGGNFSSTASSVSADGSVVVGFSESASGLEAFRWTSGGGMVGLGDLPGGIFSSSASGVSADGSVVVGQSRSDSGDEAFRWTRSGGMQSVASILTAAGVDLTGWTLLSATGVSADGNTITGYGINPDGFQEAWMANVPADFTAAGDLDSTFDSDGIVVTDFSGNADGNAVAVQSDGKIIVAGQAGDDFVVVRYNSDGSLDTSFGSGGIVTTDFGASDQAYGVAIQTDGKIVVAGTSGSDFALARYNDNGEPDTTFGNSGLVTTDVSVSGPGDSGRAVAIQSDGKIVVAGYSYDSTQFEEFALLRYNADGTLDTGFGSGGIVVTTIGDITEDRGYAVAIQSDGKIVVAGESFQNFALARYTSDGVLDTSFDSDGIVITDFGRDDVGYAVAIQTDGKIVVAGASSVFDSSTTNCMSSGGRFCQYMDFSVARYNGNGSLDTGFSDDGKVTTDLNLRGNDDFARAVAIQSDGKIVAAGYSETSIHTFSGEDEFFSRDNQFSLARFTSNGALDTTFSADGIVVTDIDGSSDERGNAVAIQTDSKIVVAGSYNESSAFSVIRYIGASEIPTTPVDLSGTIKTSDGEDICAMVLASGQFMFSCNPPGVFSLTDLPREDDGTVKRQIYADGFFPKVDVLPGSSNDAVVMTRSGSCPRYNTPYEPGTFPGSAGDQIDISGRVLTSDGQTPICAMVLANGQFMFSCDGTGSYALTIPLDTNGQFKLQVYADGFAPTIQIFDEFKTTNDVRMARAVECQ